MIPLDDMAVALLRDRARREPAFRRRIEAELKRRRPRQKPMDLASMVSRHLSRRHRAPAIVVAYEPEPEPIISGDDVKRAIRIISGIPTNDLISHRRDKTICRWRHIAAWLMHLHCPRLDTFPAIGRALGGRHHATIMHGLAKVKDRYEDYRADIERVEGVL